MFALQYCVGFCHVSAGICHRHTHVPSPRASLLPSSPSHPSHPSHPSRHHRALALSSPWHAAHSCWLAASHKVMYVSACFTQGNVCRLLSLFTPPSPSSNNYCFQGVMWSNCLCPEIQDTWPLLPQDILNSKPDDGLCAFVQKLGPVKIGNCSKKA